MSVEKRACVHLGILNNYADRTRLFMSYRTGQTTRLITSSRNGWAINPESVMRFEN